jgi:hypothetical protein
MAIPNQNAFLAHAGNADVKAYVDGGGNFNDWWNNYGQNENRQWQVPANQSISSPPPPAPTPTPAPYTPDLSYVDWTAYAAANPDLEAAGLTTKDQLVNHWQTYGQHEAGRSLGFQPLVNNQGQFYNHRDGTPIGPTNAGEMNAFANNNFTNHTGFDPNTFAGTGGGITDPSIMNPDAVNFVQGGGSMAGTSATYGRNAFDPNAFESMFNDWTTQFQQNQQNQYRQYTDQFQNNLWNTTPQSPTYAANSWITDYNQSPTLDPVYQANNGGAQNGFQPTFNQSNPFSIRTF